MTFSPKKTIFILFIFDFSFRPNYIYVSRFIVVCWSVRISRSIRLMSTSLSRIHSREMEGYKHICVLKKSDFYKGIFIREKEIRVHSPWKGKRSDQTPFRITDSLPSEPPTNDLLMAVDFLFYFFPLLPCPFRLLCGLVTTQHE